MKPSISLRTPLFASLVFALDAYTLYQSREPHEDGARPLPQHTAAETGNKP